MMSARFHADCDIDITSDICPMTFVRTRLALDRLLPGQTLGVTLCGEEPIRSVPANARAQGHGVVVEEALGGGVVRVVLRKHVPC